MSTRETLTVAGTAVGLTLATIRALGEDYAVLTVEDAPIRYTVDGTTATASIGHLARVGSTITLDSSTEITKFSAIRIGGVSASVQVHASIGRINRG